MFHQHGQDCRQLWWQLSLHSVRLAHNMDTLVTCSALRWGTPGRSSCGVLHCGILIILISTVPWGTGQDCCDYSRELGAVRPRLLKEGGLGGG